MGVDLVALALSASLDVFSDFISHSRPPVLIGYNVGCTRDSRVAIDGGIMVCCYELSSLFYITCYDPSSVLSPHPSFLSEVMGVYPPL